MDAFIDVNFTNGLQNIPSFCKIGHLYNFVALKIQMDLLDLGFLLLMCNVM